jgi:hypothetical protein
MTLFFFGTILKTVLRYNTTLHTRFFKISIETVLKIIAYNKILLRKDLFQICNLIVKITLHSL